MMSVNPQTLLLIPIVMVLAACNENRDDIAPVVKAPQISNISQTANLLLGQKATLTVTGQNFSTTNIKILSDNCHNPQLELVSTTRINFSCQPQRYGKQQITITDQQNKALLSKAFVVDMAQTQVLNDTGINTCVNDNSFLPTQCTLDEPAKWLVSVQDGAIGRDFLATQSQLSKQGKGNAGFDFSKVSATGELLPDNSSTWHCILDHTTGLLWEAKTNDGGLHDATHTYTWYHADDSTNGGVAGDINEGKNTDAFVKQVNQVGLCGYHDWSLPNIAQLQSIVDYGKANPAIDQQYFKHTQAATYWSSSSFSDGSVALAVSFDYGLVRNYPKRHRFDATQHFVRLVRSAPSPQ